MVTAPSRRAILFALAAAATGSSSAAAQLQDRSGWPKELRFAIVPNEGEKVINAYTKLLAHVEAEIGLPIRTYKVTDVAAVIVAMSNGQVDAARFGAESYVIAREKASAEAIAVESTVAGGKGYHGHLWTMANSGIDTLEAAKGRTLAFNDPNSTSGYLVVLEYFVNSLKTRPEDYFSRIVFAGGALPSVQALVNEKVDVAAFSDTYKTVAVKQGVAKDSELRSIWQSGLIPNPPYVLRSSLPQSLKDAYRSALLSFKDPAVLAALPGGVEKIVAAADADYDPVRKLREVKAKLAKQ